MLTACWKYLVEIWHDTHTLVGFYDVDIVTLAIVSEIFLWHAVLCCYEVISDKSK